MVFTIHATDGLARCGTFLTRHAQLATPAPLLYTRRGGALYLTPDLLARLSAARRPGGGASGKGENNGDAPSSSSSSSSCLMLGLVTTQFLDQPSPELLTALVAASARGGGGRQAAGDDDNAAAAAAASSVPVPVGGAGVAWAGLQGWPAFALNRDPLAFEYGPPAGARPGTNNGPHVAVASGACLASLPAWMAAVRVMAPDCFVGLADELPACSSCSSSSQGREGEDGGGDTPDAAAAAATADGTASDGLQRLGMEEAEEILAAVAAAEARAGDEARAPAAARRRAGGGEPDEQGRVAPPPLPPLPAKAPTKPPRLAFPPGVDPRVARAVERTAWWLDRSLAEIEEAQQDALAAAASAAASAAAAAAAAALAGGGAAGDLSGPKGGVMTAGAARALARKERARGMPAPFERRGAKDESDKADADADADDADADADDADADDLTPAPPPLQFFAPIVGCDSPAARLVSAREAARRDGPSVAGYALCGFGTGEPHPSRLPLLRAALAPLPASKPRVCSGLDGGPLEVLDAVAAGVDIFDCAWPTASTGAGYALSFPIEPEEAVEGGPYDDEEEEEAQEGNDKDAATTDAPWAAAAPAPVASASAAAASAAAEAAGGPTRGRRLPDGARINLWARGFRLDGRPLAPGGGCACPACAPAALSHGAAAAAAAAASVDADAGQQAPSRAYLHHLLAVEEMTAEVLLDLHNSHHWLRFFGAVRRAVARGELAGYRAWLAAWLERRQY